LLAAILTNLGRWRSSSRAEIVLLRTHTRSVLRALL
jgi:hypothetical protein